MVSSVLRKLGLNGAIASAALATFLAFGAHQPAVAQLYSDGYKFLEAVEDRDGDTATAMLDEPGNQIVNSRDITSGDTGLHLVVKRRDILWVKFLLQRGANPNLRNNDGVAPIQIATRMGFIEAVEELIKKGALVDLADMQGETPLISAVHQRNVELVRRLLVQGADPDHNDNSGRSARDYMELLSSNTLLKREFAAADEARKGQSQQPSYGPSF